MAKQIGSIEKIIRKIELNASSEKEDEEKESQIYEHIFEHMRSFVLNPRDGVLLAPYLSVRMPSSTSSEKLEEIIDIVSEKIFNPPTERGINVTAYAVFCKGFGDLKVTKEVKGFKRLLTFEEILAEKIITKLEARFSYKTRLMDQMKIHPGPPEAKLRWLENQTEKQKRKLRTTADMSVQFLKEIHTIGSETVYKIMDFLLANADEEHLEYLCLLLKALGKELDGEIARKHRIQSPTPRNFLNDDRIKLNTVFRKISLLAVGNPSISTNLKTMMQDLIKLRQVGWKITSEDKVSLQSDRSSISSVGSRK